MGGWISVREGLPEFGVDVLAYVAGMVVVASLDADDGWQCENDDVAGDVPTHWMPLPPPPQDDGNGFHDG